MLPSNISNTGEIQNKTTDDSIEDHFDCIFKRLRKIDIVLDEISDKINQGRKSEVKQS